MKDLHPPRPLLRLMAGLALAATAAAQTAPTSTAPAASSTTRPAEPAKEEVLALNPFEVRAETDNSYGALNSNSITRFNTELNKVPVSADIFTEDFMRDVAATSIEQLLADYGAGMGLASPAPDSDAALNQPGDRIGNLQVGTRGLAAGAVHRDGFTSVGSLANPGSTAVGTTSTFDVEAAEVIRGPQGLLYGAGGAGGTINTRSKRAAFNRRNGSVQYRIDQYGSKQVTLDYNWGGKNAAVRFSLLDEDQKYRRVFIGGETKGYYVQFAYRWVPAKTTLRLQLQRTVNERINATSVNDIAFTNAATDPRHNYSLSYLLANGLQFATNPATGQPWPRGAIANGGLTWDNLNSWGGWASSEYVSNNVITADAETVWAKWLSSQVTLRYNDYKSDRIFSGISGLSAPLLNGNPLNEWANGVDSQDTEQPTRRSAIRGSVLATNQLFRHRAKSQTMAGYDIEWADQGPTDFAYYLADANWNVIRNPAIPNDLGRTRMPRRWWAVGSSPVMKPVEKPGWATPRITYNGQNYVRMERNPRDPAWISATNELGTASGAGFPGVSGSNNRGHQQLTRVAGYYLTNYTLWFDDKLGTLLGFRANETMKKNPDSAETTKSNQSFNLGANYALREWLRAFYSFSSTYNTPIANANDPLGNAPKTSSGTGHEAGVKFNTRDNRFSGSLQYYWTDSKDEMINAGTGVRDLINPAGLNGSHEGPAGGKNQWVNLDRTTRGLELILTASPTRNWRMRLSATTADGQNLTNKTYPLLFNDEFYVRNGAVTYANGTPFLVPIDAPTIQSQVATRNAIVNPATIQGQGTWVPLTVAMLNDRTGPYWAQPANDNGRVQGVNLRNVLRFFVGANGSALTGRTGLSRSDIPYQWDDSNGTNGVTVVGRKGEFTVGYAQYRVSFTNFYTFDGDNWLKGVGLGGTVSASMKNRTFYYNTPGGGRELYRAPETLQVNLIASYRHRIGKRFMWLTQVNVNNLFNSYSLGTLPNNGSGYTNPANLNVTFYGQPRMYTWTNTISF